jgi:hypothetical protein
MGVKCFLLQPAPFRRRSLRRYASESTCSGPMSYHDASVDVEVFASPVPTENETDDESAIPQGDPRWPKQCLCGCAFTEKDTWQVNDHRLWRRDRAELPAAPLSNR